MKRTYQDKLNLLSEEEYQVLDAVGNAPAKAQTNIAYINESTNLTSAITTHALEVLQRYKLIQVARNNKGKYYDLY